MIGVACGYNAPLVVTGLPLTAPFNLRAVLLVNVARVQARTGLINPRNL